MKIILNLSIQDAETGKTIPYEFGVAARDWWGGVPVCEAPDALSGENDDDYTARQSDLFAEKTDDEVEAIIARDQKEAAAKKAAAIAKGCNCGWIATTNDAFEHRCDCPAVGMDTLRRELKAHQEELEKVLAENQKLNARVEKNYLAYNEADRDRREYQAQLAEVQHELAEKKKRLLKLRRMMFALGECEEISASTIEDIIAGRLS